MASAFHAQNVHAFCTTKGKAFSHLAPCSSLRLRNQRGVTIFTLQNSRGIKNFSSDLLIELVKNNKS
jgi:hypothetical protein